MANYVCVTRTNYFRVKDEEIFTNLMKRVVADETVDVWRTVSDDGTLYFGFGLYGSIYGLHGEDAEEDDDADIDEFFDALSKCVADDDAIIVMESGHEKMRYVIGRATVITSKKGGDIDVTTEAVRLARQLLGNPDWETRTDY